MLFLFDFFFFKQKTAYEMRISDWSSDVCSSDLPALARTVGDGLGHLFDVAVARIVQHKNLCHREPHNFRMVEWRSGPLAGSPCVFGQRHCDSDRGDVSSTLCPPASNVSPWPSDRQSTRLNSSH